ncbi:lipoate--protein ligase family protein [Glutamicibacter protophormiae]|uniref:lipoate--protein ligase family protein n=1 Tax=Glutamicibacter protophormiae TaxID=37930 RepID=UPI001955FDB0|nr:lipoate--protein ligase family protein [Glutamicibacter protophormiae]QRQ77151.1 lipoate--protein ligase family protein [Glutamicibacter protophormiae]
MTLWNRQSDAPLTLLREDPSGAPGDDLERGVQLLREVQSGERGPLLRLYRPDPTLAFGQRDVRLPGFELARQAAEEHGFAPLVRKAGGRAAAYHRGTLIVDHIEPQSEAIMHQQQRFEIFARLYADAFRRVGVQAEVGPIDGEYCVGEHSVHGVPGAVSAISHSVKLVGTAQRVISGAWLFSSVFVVENSQPLRRVLDAVYQAMEVPMNPETVGAGDDLVPGLTTEALIVALLAEYREHVAVLEPEAR